MSKFKLISTIVRRLRERDPEDMQRITSRSTRWGRGWRSAGSCGRR